MPCQSFSILCRPALNETHKWVLLLLKYQLSAFGCFLLLSLESQFVVFVARFCHNSELGSSNFLVLCVFDIILVSL